MEKINIGILFGGVSSEHEISLLSTSSILRNINKDRYNIYKIGITKKGEMFYYTGDIDSIEKNLWHEKNCTPCFISTNRNHHGIIIQNTNETIRLDTVFPVLHGKNGEDGTIQGLLSFANIPYVGCDMISSANCMDKEMTHTILDTYQIKTARYLVAKAASYSYKKESLIKEIEEKLHYPCFVKPANAGSSVGVSKATNKESLLKAIDIAFLEDRKVIIEEMIIGTEIECAVLGNEDPIASTLGEIVSCNEFYDYNAKYIDGKTLTYIPARINEEAFDKIRKTALKAYKAMGCEGFSRIDFFLTDDNKVILNEINTIPGFTSISMYPQLFVASGIPYSELIDRLITLSMERN